MKKTLKDFMEVYRPKSPDEQKFVDKHVTVKHKDRNGNGDDVFKATNVKTDNRKETRHGYDSGEDEKVYEELVAAYAEKYDMSIDEIESIIEEIIEEEVEDLDELSKGTLKNYVKKAANRTAYHTAQQMVARDPGNMDYHGKKAMNKVSGISKAADRLAKEETELDELNREMGGTISRYINRTKDDPKREAGRNLALKKRWGDKNYGTEEPRVKAVDRFKKEEVEEIDELSRKTLRAAGGLLLRRGLGDGPKAEKSMKSSNLASAKLYPDQHKNSPLKAKVNATNEEVELEEGTVGYKNYSITAQPNRSAMREIGDIKHSYGHDKKLNKLGVNQSEKEHYGPTHHVTVKNNETGDVTHHHVYQSYKKDSTGKPTISIRGVGKPHEQHGKHANVIAHYISGKTKIKEDLDIEFDTVLDEDTFTDASLANLRVMKHKQMMKELENSSKIHPLMKVRRLSDAKKKLTALEADRDYHVAKHEKAQAKRKKIKEEVEIDEKTLTPAEMKKREEIAKAMERENPGMPMAKKMAIATAQAKKVAEEVEEIDESAKIAAHLIKRYGDNVRKSHVVSAAKDFGVDASKLAKAVRTKLGKTTLGEEQIDELSNSTLDSYASKALKDREKHRIMSSDQKNKWEQRTKGMTRAAMKYSQQKEEVEEIDEISKSTLASYIPKAARSATGLIAGATAAGMSNSPSSHGREMGRTAVKRLKGIETATKKITKEDIINRTIEKYVPEEVKYTAEERMIKRLEGLSERHIETLMGIFESLNTDNQNKMLMVSETQEGINSLIDFAITNRGE